MARGRGTAVCGVLDISRMCVRLGSIPPVLLHIHSLDSLSPWLPLLRGIACAALLRFSSSGSRYYLGGKADLPTQSTTKDPGCQKG
ncbi:hypothetical protein Pelo_1266 [Pelomyxa schiedti]|nr:hypothetical protein Pelo_1266 [Pelomyxa schiedti]